MHIFLCYNHRSQGKRIHELEDKLACVLSKVRRLEKKMHLIAQLSPAQDKDRRTIVKALALQVFKEEDLATHSLSGKKGPKQVGDCRPALDQAKLSFLERMVHQKCGIDHKDFVEEMQLVQKVIRKTCALQVFKEEDLATHSLSGKKGPKQVGDCRPALDLWFNILIP